MDYTKETPVGIDVNIQGLQSLLYKALKATWGITDADWSSYGRSYKTQTQDGFTPYVFDGGTEYKEVYFDDTVKVVSFFGINDTVNIVKGNSTLNVYLIFQVNVTKLKPGITWFADEEVRNDVLTLTKGANYGLRMTGIVTGIEAVFKEYSGWKKTQGLKYKDAAPLHFFRLNFELLYNIAAKSCGKSIS